MVIFRNFMFTKSEKNIFLLKPPDVRWEWGEKRKVCFRDQNFLIAIYYKKPDVGTSSGFTHASHFVLLWEQQIYECISSSLAVKFWQPVILLHLFPGHNTLHAVNIIVVYKLWFIVHRVKSSLKHLKQRWLTVNAICLLFNVWRLQFLHSITCRNKDKLLHRFWFSKRLLTSSPLPQICGSWNSVSGKLWILCQKKRNDYIIRVFRESKGFPSPLVAIPRLDDVGWRKYGRRCDHAQWHGVSKQATEVRERLGRQPFLRIKRKGSSCRSSNPRNITKKWGSIKVSSTVPSTSGAASPDPSSIRSPVITKLIRN